MNLDVPRGGLVALALFAVTGVVLFMLMAARFGGPSLQLEDPFVLRASIPDAQGLAVRSDVRVRGVRVGRVRSLRRAGGLTDADLALEGVTVRRGASLRVGQKTLLGEAYVDLDPGPARAPELGSGARVPARDAVEIDEALAALGPGARTDLQDLLAETGEAAADPLAPARFNATLGELRRTTAAVRRLGATLRDQRADLSGAVSGSRAVMGELAGRDRAVRSLVRDGHRLLTATASADASLREGLDELPRLMTAARTTLARARPVLADARPLAASLRDAAPDLRRALDDLPPAARDLRVALAGAPALDAAARPLLRDVDRLLPALRPAARRLGPALANLVPMLRYLEPRRDAIAAWFANTADLGLNGDAKGSWARFFIFFDPATGGGQPSTLAANAYPPPGDAAANRPYRAGEYPRLMPFREAITAAGRSSRR